MEVTQIERTIVDVLKRTQQDRGLNDRNIHGGTVPLDDLEKFDSDIWPTVIGDIADALGINIPPDKNIFKNGRGKLNIREIANGLTIYLH